MSTIEACDDPNCEDCAMLIEVEEVMAKVLDNYGEEAGVMMLLFALNEMTGAEFTFVENQIEVEVLSPTKADVIH